MSRFRMHASVCVFLLLAGTAAPLRAQSFMMTMQGILDSRSFITGPGASSFGAATPFTLTAFFNTTTLNFVAPIGVSGFVAYTPSRLELAVSGRTYGVLPFTFANPTGLAVAIFDATTPFDFGRYGAGVIQNPLADGAGIIADFSGAAPPFVIGTTGIRPTTFTGFNGVGVSSGVCLVGPPNACAVNAVTPIPLTFGSDAYSLTLGSYSQDVGPSFSYSVRITAVPEPGSMLLVGMGVLGIGAFVRRRRRSTIAGS
ncbi:MAG: PEP-CTERM sorting domain-containing protein [Gemmatimonadaceae bacterium]